MSSSQCFSCHYSAHDSNQLVKDYEITETSKALGANGSVNSVENLEKAVDDARKELQELTRGPHTAEQKKAAVDKFHNAKIALRKKSKIETGDES